MANGRLIHVRLPDDLLRQVDDAAESRHRSAVIAEALREYFRIRALQRAVDQGRGVLAAEDGPWRSDEDVDHWVERLRSGWERKEP